MDDDLSLRSGRRRAMMTQTERENVVTTPPKDHRTALARVRNRIPELVTDLALLREHEPALYRRLMTAVMCEVVDVDPDTLSDSEDPSSQELASLFFEAGLDERGSLQETEPTSGSTGRFAALSFETGDQTR